MKYRYAVSIINTWLCLEIKSLNIVCVEDHFYGEGGYDPQMQETEWKHTVIYLLEHDQQNPNSYPTMYSLYV